MHTFSKRYVIPFTRADVYAHWVSSETVIALAQRMEVDAVPGGVYRLVMPGGFSMEGEFAEVVPEQRLVYFWQWQGSDERTQIEVEFDSEDQNTTIDLTHSGFTSQESHNNHAQGWDNYIEGFTQHLQDIMEA